MFLSIKDHSGVTLVEVIVAMLLVGIVTFSLTGAVLQSSVFSERVDVIYTASYLAQRKVDMLKRLDFNQLDSSVAETNVRIDGTGTLNPDGKYLRTTAITTNYDGNSYLKKIKVSIARVKVNIDGTIIDSKTGQVNFLSRPITVETLLSEVR
jgi:prepilin-type N-terminal cleavage/methylation domain-containing protein